MALLLGLTALFRVPLFEPLVVGGVFTSPASLVTVLSTIAATLAALVSIVIAVVLVSLQILQQTYANIALQEAFRTATFRRFLTLYIYTIALALFVSASVGQAVAAWVISLSYLVGLLTLGCLLALYPSLKHILTTTRADNRRLTELAETISPVARMRFRGPLTIEQLESLEHDPLYVLGEIAIRGISGGDRVTPRMAIGVVADRLSELLERGVPEESRDLFRVFLPFFRAVERAVVKHRDELTLDMLIDAIEVVHQQAAHLKLSWSNLIEWDEFLENVAAGCVEIGADIRSVLLT